MDKSDYERLWNLFWIDNLEEALRNFEKTKNENQENINKKYPITKEDILMFSNIFYNKKLELYTQAVLPTQYIFKVPETLLISFWERNEIVNDISKNKIILFFKLLQKWYIILYLKDYIIYNETEKTNKLRRLLEEYRIKKNDPQNEVFITSMWYGESLNKKYTLWESIKNTFKWKNKTFKLERNWVKFFMNDLLDNHMEEFIENLDYWVDFNFMMFDKNFYVHSILKEIENFKTNIQESIQIEELFLEIKEQIWNKNNHSKSILLSYPLQNYIDNKRYYYEIVNKLHDMEYLTLKELYIYQSSVNFVIEKINRFDYSVKNKLYPIYERINFIWWDLKLDSKILISGKKYWDKIYDLINIIVFWIKKYKKLELSYVELKNIFLENEKDYPYIYKTLNKKWIYEKNKNILMKSKNQILKDETMKMQEELLNKVFQLSFFNSSLSKENIEFILKKETTWLLINAN